MNKEREERTMIDKEALSIMANIMDGIEQTDEWTELQINDPGIKDADRRLNMALDAAEKYIPRKVYAELADAHSGAVAAYSDVAILYGMRVAAVIQVVTANPAAMTRFWLEKQEANR